MAHTMNNDYINRSIAFRENKKDTINLQAVKRGYSINNYCVGALEADSRGELMFLRDDCLYMNTHYQMRRILYPKGAAPKEIDEIMNALPEKTSSGIYKAAADCGVYYKDIIIRLSELLCTSATYSGAYSLFYYLRQYGCDPEELVDAFHKAGIITDIPETCIPSPKPIPIEESRGQMAKYQRKGIKSYGPKRGKGRPKISEEERDMFL